VGHLDRTRTAGSPLLRSPCSSLCTLFSPLGHAAAYLQAIAAMSRAKEANPANLSVLLALGVSHTNGTPNLAPGCYCSFLATPLSGGGYALLVSATP